MQISTLTKPNIKGQIVIPKKLRDKLGISHETTIEIIEQGRGFFVAPVSGYSVRASDGNKAWLEVLKRTQGAWGPETAEEKKHRLAMERRERLAVKKMREAW